MATSGFLIKRTANGFVAIKESFVPNGSSFIVDPETTYIFKTFEEMAAWLGMNFVPTTGQQSTISMLHPDGPRQ